MARGRVTGLGLAFINGGEIVYLNAFGRANTEKAPPDRPVVDVCGLVHQGDVRLDGDSARVYGMSRVSASCGHRENDRAG